MDFRVRLSTAVSKSENKLWTRIKMQSSVFQIEPQHLLMSSFTFEFSQSVTCALCVHVLLRSLVEEEEERLGNLCLEAWESDWLAGVWLDAPPHMD